MEQRDTLQEIYSRMRKVECKGLCQRYCSVIGMPKIEMDSIQQAAGKEARCREDLSCNYLNEQGRCDIYEDRPIICRSFGAYEGNICPYGCEPKEGLGPVGELFMLMMEIEHKFHDNIHISYWTGTEEQVLADMAMHSNKTIEQVKEERLQMWRQMGSEGALLDKSTTIYKED